MTETCVKAALNARRRLWVNVTVSQEPRSAWHAWHVQNYKLEFGLAICSERLRREPDLWEKTAQWLPPKNGTILVPFLGLLNQGHFDMFVTLLVRHVQFRLLQQACEFHPSSLLLPQPNWRIFWIVYRFNLFFKMCCKQLSSLSSWNWAAVISHHNMIALHWNWHFWWRTRSFIGAKPMQRTWTVEMMHTWNGKLIP